MSINSTFIHFGTNPTLNTTIYTSQAPGNVSTMALGEEGGTATTLALGEEGGGGGGSTTGVMFEDGGGTPSTLALGEEGGGTPSTLAFGEEGGGIPTTLALGEEGGGGGTPPPPTMAFWEDGGGGTTFFWGESGGDVPPVTGVFDNGAQKTTRLYLDFQQAADTRGNGDGLMTQAEAQQEITRYQGQISAIQQLTQILSDVLPPYLVSGFLGTVTQQIQDKIKVGERLLNNFALFTYRLQPLPGTPQAPTPGPAAPIYGPDAIAKADIQRVSLLDRNPYDLSNRDLNQAYQQSQLPILGPQPQPPV